MVILDIFKKNKKKSGSGYFPYNNFDGTRDYDYFTHNRAFDFDHTWSKIYLGDLFKNYDSQIRECALPIPVGLDDGDPECFVIKDLAKIFHLLIAGCTGTGKSVQMHNIIASLLLYTDAKIAIIDPKGNEFFDYRNCKNVQYVDGKNFADVARRSIVILDQMVSEISKRNQVFRESGCRNIDEYNAKSKKRYPRKVILIDEFSGLCEVSNMEALEIGLKNKKQVHDTIEGYISKIAKMGRSAGVHLILTDQTPSAKIVSTALKTNIPGKLSFRLDNIHASKTVELPEAMSLPEVGWCAFRDGSPKHYECQTALCTTDDIKKIVAIKNAIG